MIKEMNGFQHYLQSSYKTATVNLTTFPSSAAILDMKVNGLLLTLEYVPSKGFAVTTIGKVEDAWAPDKCVTFEESCFSQVRAYFLQLLAQS